MLIQSLPGQKLCETSTISANKLGVMTCPCHSSAGAINRGIAVLVGLGIDARLFIKYVKKKQGFSDSHL
jgi:hypothetical protein